MKKILSTLMAITLLFSSISCSYNNSDSNESTERENNYFKQKIFNSIKESNIDLYNELVKGKITKKIVDGVEVVYIQLKNGYFIDDNSKIIYSEINKRDNTILIYDFTENKKTKFNLLINDKGFYNGIDKSKVPDSFHIFDTSTSENLHLRGCRDYAGFALCYAAVLISATAIAASDGPLPFMDAAAISYLVTATAGCHRSNC